MHANHGKFHNLLDFFFFFWNFNFWRGKVPRQKLLTWHSATRQKLLMWHYATRQKIGLDPAGPHPHLLFPLFLFFFSFLPFFSSPPLFHLAPDSLSLYPATKAIPLLRRWHCSSGGFLSPAGDHPICFLIQAAYIFYIYITVSIYIYILLVIYNM